MKLPYESIFLIPFIVGVAYVIREAILYNKEMKYWINHPDWQFTLTEKDGLPYVVPKLVDKVTYNAVDTVPSLSRNQQVEHQD